MYTIYVGNKPIILTTNIEKETDFRSFLLKTVNIGKVIKILNTTDLKGVHLIHKNEDKLLPNFLKLLPNTVAGGGKVFNSNNEVLFIYRNNKWDLPKGKIEGKESIEETAKREVEEETGVEGLKITNQLPTTYHIFKRNGRHKIKITYWFEMKTNFDGKLFPQEKEGITDVKWLNNEASQKALKNSYANIRILV
ncbi:NUDIX hydrolase [Winogradskyella alexanderae]|uniref:NUDIX domain-containing protein n=1 Tax=Winogradskyella alexanderae TaxID=2877123 RepID=A0ABS7XW73_9FLAO|nr:NUDIX domain-containing protein [Winogradskyella alexanderae]MCA0133673.1 NUDIX domain-containing protein [Winogradskyella alexanderae]